jgi:hypothetical protein
LDTVTEISKANKSRKKKEPNPLEAERQKALVRSMKRWLGKNRSQGQLHTKSNVPTTTISDALNKPDTITSVENTLDILHVVATPREFLLFVQKFFRSFNTALSVALKIQDKHEKSTSKLIDFAIKHIDEEGNVRQEYIKSITEKFVELISEGVLISGAENESLVGGKSLGAVIEVSHPAFEDILAESGKRKIIKVGPEEYSLNSVHPDKGLAVFKDTSLKNWVIVVSSESSV